MAANFSQADLCRWKKEINPGPVAAKRIKVQRVNDEWLACCPDVFHKANLGKSDSHPSFTIYKLADGTWGYKCFSCGANGNVFQFVQAIDKISFPAAVRRVLDEAGVEGWQDGSTQDEVNVPTEEAAPKDHVTFPITQYQPAVEALEHAPEGQAWLRKRGISMETARQFKIGFVQSASKIVPVHAWRDDGWILFPTLSADEQTVTGAKYRSMVGKKKKQGDGKMISGILRAPDTATTLYNMQAVKPGEDVWVVEGEPDTLALAQAGLTAVGYPSGEYKPTDPECDVLRRAKRRFLAGDADKVGKVAMEALGKRMPEETYLIRWPEGCKDANDVLVKECGCDATAFALMLEDLKVEAMEHPLIDESVVRNSAEIRPKKIKWLWQDRIPLGKITLFAGNPDNGKSLATTSVAAIVSTGRPFPNATEALPPSDVLMLLGEDDIDDTVVPRLIAAGANRNRIYLMEAIKQAAGDEIAIRLDHHIPAIEKQLQKHPSIRLVVIDPISNYLGEVSMVAEQEARAAILIPLKNLAAKYGVAIIMVMHLNKKNDLDAISRVGGAMAFIGVARSSWLFVRDTAPEPEDGGEEKTLNTFAMVKIKNNIAFADKDGLAYSIETERVEIPDEGATFVPYVAWGGCVAKSANTALGGKRASAGRPKGTNSKIEKAKAWLAAQLQGGPKDGPAICKAALDEENFSKSLMYEAADELNVLKKDGRWSLKPMHATTESIDSNEPIVVDISR